MSTNPDNTRRARRLLRWYPPAWRERYGEEFVDHLEREFADRPIDFKRSVNVARKGLAARVGDLGLSESGVNPNGQARAALGTSFALTALMIVVMLDLWSRAMAAWSSRTYHPIPVNITTGILTAAMALLLLALPAVVIVVVLSAARQILRGRGRSLLGPSLLALVSGGFLLYAARLLPRLFSIYIHGAHGFPGTRLSDPGQVIANLASITWDLTLRWVAPWNQGIPPLSTTQTIVDDSVLLAMFAFGIAVALLIRRVELPPVGARLVFPAVTAIGALTGLFFIAYMAWSAFGGTSNFEYFFPESPWLGVVYLVLLGLVPLLALRSALIVRRADPGDRRIHLEIVDSRGASSFD
jgi:NADH:ubiquinone oxidoreductase subunit 3 (subunit A)